MMIYNNVIYSELIELVNNIQKLQGINTKITFEGIKVRFNTIISINKKEWVSLIQIEKTWRQKLIAVTLKKKRTWDQ